MSFSLFKLLNDCQLISVNILTEYNKDFKSGIESQCAQIILWVWVGN